MAEKYWTQLETKNGDIVKFVPPPPTQSMLGGVTKEQRQRIGAIGNLTNLNTENKQSLVDAVNQLRQNVGGGDIMQDPDDPDGGNIKADTRIIVYGK